MHADVAPRLDPALVPPRDVVRKRLCEAARRRAPLGRGGGRRGARGAHHRVDLQRRLLPRLPLPMRLRRLPLPRPRRHLPPERL